MSKESFFKTNVSLHILKDSFLKDYIIKYDPEYDELTLRFIGYTIWMYVYYEDTLELYINIKYESKISDTAVMLFEKELAKLSLKSRTF